MTQLNGPTFVEYPPWHRYLLADAQSLATTKKKPQMSQDALGEKAACVEFGPPLSLDRMLARVV